MFTSQAGVDTYRPYLTIIYTSGPTYVGVLKRWNWASWVKAKLQRYNGSSFVDAKLKVYKDGSFGEVDTTGI